MTQTPNSTAAPSGAFAQRFRDLGSLRRPTDHRAVAGVADGLSRHFDIDPIIVRVLFAALTFFGGAGLILYVVLWLTVPSDSTQQSIVSARLRRDPAAWTTIGLAVGGIFAAVAFLGSLSWAVPHPFPSLLITAILVICVLALARKGERTAPPPPAAYSGPPAGTAPTDTPPPDLAPTVVQPTFPSAVPGTAVLVAPTTSQPKAWWQRDDVPPGGAPLPPVVPPPPKPKRTKSHLFGMTMATVALAVAGVWIVDATSSYDVNPSVYPGVALGVIAIGLLVGAWWGRARGLIAMGIVAGLCTAVAAFVGPGPYGDRSAAPREAAQLHSSYSMGTGRFILHLERVRDIDALQGRTVDVKQRIGQLKVIIPSSVAAVVNATTDHGSVVGPSPVEEISEGGERVALRPEPDGRPVVTLNLHMIYGEIRIERAECRGAGPAGAGETHENWQGNSYDTAACN